MIILKEQIIYSFVHGIQQSSLVTVLRNHFGFGEVVPIHSSGGYLYSPKLSFFHPSYYKVLVLPRPSEWFRELWILKSIKGWDGSDLQNKCKSDNFQEFVSNVIKTGVPHYHYFLTQYYDDIKDVDDVVRVESFAHEFLSATNRGLKRNLPVSIPNLAETSLVLEHPDYAKFRKMAEFASGQAEALNEMNKKVMDNFF